MRNAPYYTAKAQKGQIVVAVIAVALTYLVKLHERYVGLCYNKANG